jgi:hypothetical protein
MHEGLKQFLRVCGYANLALLFLLGLVVLGVLVL